MVYQLIIVDSNGDHTSAPVYMREIYIPINIGSGQLSFLWLRDMKNHAPIIPIVIPATASEGKWALTNTREMAIKKA
jgi:hypothetical protein